MDANQQMLSEIDNNKESKNKSDLIKLQNESVIHKIEIICDIFFVFRYEQKKSYMECKQKSMTKTFEKSVETNRKGLKEFVDNLDKLIANEEEKNRLLKRSKILN